MIIVCPLNSVAEQVRLSGARHAVSLLGPPTPPPEIDGIGGDNHLKLMFHDIVVAREGLEPPQALHVERLLAFVEAWPREAPLLIHCYAGISRSTAAAYISWCALRPDLDEQQLAQRLRTASPSATPNALMVSFADKLLKRDGAMVRAISAIGRGEEAYEGTPFRLEI
jgi:predicted protein tyrosine phosphatase